MAVQAPAINISSSPSTTQNNVPPSSHRLPAVSASQALLNLKSNGPDTIPTGLPSLDHVLASNGTQGTGGFRRGKVTEIWGPSGAGKTAVALEAMSKAIGAGKGVLWVDACAPLSGQRLQSTVARLISQDDARMTEELLRRFHHITTSTLSHLLALFLHPRADFPPGGTSLVVIRGLNKLIDIDFPRVIFGRNNKTEQQKWQAGRRYAILGSLGAALHKLAVVNNMAILVLTGCASRQRAGSGLGAAIVPAIGGTEWDTGICDRLVIFRDFGGRFVGVQKCQGRSLISREEAGEIGCIVGFDIAGDGSLQERRPPGHRSDRVEPLLVTPVPDPARSKKRTYEEIADSDDDDADEYGWVEMDEDTLTAEGPGDEQTQPENG